MGFVKNPHLWGEKSGSTFQPVERFLESEIHHHEIQTTWSQRPARF